MTPVLYLDDLAPGQTHTTPTLTVSEADIIAFAREYDPQPFHLDEEAARQSLFGGLAASGWHTAALTMRLIITGGMPIASGTVGLGGEITWPTPMRPGDRLRVESTVLVVTPSRSKPDRGVVAVENLTKNQKDEIVQRFVAKLMVPRRPAGEVA